MASLIQQLFRLLNFCKAMLYALTFWRKGGGGVDKDMRFGYVYYIRLAHRPNIKFELLELIKYLYIVFMLCMPSKFPLFKMGSDKEIDIALQ